jgi:aspartate/methionine/tyrosine aminotransferase
MNLRRPKHAKNTQMARYFARRTNWNLTTNAYSKALEQHRQAGKELLDLTASNPTTIGLHYDGEKLLRSLSQPEALTYEPTAKGLLLARQAIAGFYAERGAAVDPDDLILTTSTSEAYSFVFRLLCNTGDTVLVPMPSYPLFEFLADLQDVKLRRYELVYDHGWQMDFHSLESAVPRDLKSHPVVQHPGNKGAAPDESHSTKTRLSEAPDDLPRCRAVLVVHPNNPTGSFVKPHEAAQLTTFCAENGLAIISDEVFLDYALDPTGAPSFISGFASGIEGRALTFTLSGLSKISGLPQMKVAWIAVSGPDELKREALSQLEVIADTYLSMNAPVQWAIPAMLDERRNIQPQLMTRIRANLAELDRQLAMQKLCSRLDFEGGWYVILRVPVTGSDEDLAVSLLQRTGVLVQPGHFYDFAADGYLIVSLITHEKIFATGLEWLFRFIAER